MKIQKLLCISIITTTAFVSIGCRYKAQPVVKNSSNIKIESKNIDNPTAPKKIELTNTKTVQTQPIIYRMGSNGDGVKEIQQDLKNLGYPINIDGDFGSGTRESIVDFQTRNDLDVDGEVGDTTLAKLKEYPTDKTKYSPIDYSLYNNDTKAFMNNNTFYSITPYFIIVNLNKKEVNIYQGSNKNWNLVQSFKCDVGEASTPTISGRFRVGIKGQSFGQDKGFLCKYFTQIHGNFLFHSILYNINGNVADSRLGMAISHGCVRLAVENAKWIYDNIPQNTQIIIR